MRYLAGVRNRLRAARPLPWPPMESGSGKGRSSAAAERQVRYGWAAQLTAGGRVLDAACGGGWGAALLAQHDASVVGVDFSPAAVADARQHYGETAEFREGDLRSLPFADAAFDHVVCFEALAHVADPGQVVGELHRVLRSGGLLLVSAPNRDVYPAGNPLHLCEISPEELESMLLTHFANVAVHRQQPYFASLLCGTETLALGDPAAEISPRVAKIAGGLAGSELHALGVATDGELPPPPSWLALGEDADRAEQDTLLREWQQRAIEAEAEAEALKRELRTLQS